VINNMDNTASFVRKLNKLGRKRIPFLFVLDFDLNSPLIYPLESLHSSQDILYQIPGNRNFIQPSYSAQKPLVLKKFPISFSTYKHAFETVQKSINRGDSFLVNLTFPTPIHVNMTLKELFFAARAPYKLWLKDRFVVFSPERFITIDEGRIFTYPMKGTIDATRDHAREIILSDKKEMAEHVTIVDLLRNDLSRYATNVGVDKFRYIDTITTDSGKLLQVSSQISGKLPSDYQTRLGDIIASMLPAGSISGAPKHKTLEIIRATEGYDRNYYTGVFGVFDGKNLKSAVMIRFIEKTESGYVFKSGGGITTFSEVDKEYQELIQKVYVPIIRKHQSISSQNLQPFLS